MIDELEIRKQFKLLEIIKKHKLLNYVAKNKKVANLYHLNEEELEAINDFRNSESTIGEETMKDMGLLNLLRNSITIIERKNELRLVSRTDFEKICFEFNRYMSAELDKAYTKGLTKLIMENIDKETIRKWLEE